jgi:HD-GYP domain-containing protein (c-di-GMP phosphodiesterase class II)
MGYDEEACERLYLTGLLHDVGKIAVSDAVLNKPGRLTDEEFAEIKRHPDEGWNILCELEQLGYVLPGVLHHHERSDGGGYPDGLVGEDIPIDGRVLAVADAYDAMTSDRAYREGMSQEQAEEILRGGAGTQWDADVIQAFFEIVDQIVALRESYQPRQRPVRKPTQPVATGA